MFAVLKNSGVKKKTANSIEKCKKDPKKIKCFKCHERGHFASQCSQKKQSGVDKDKYSGSSQKYVLVAAVKGSESTTREKRIGITAEKVRRLLEDDKADAWIGDSGAFRHIYHRRDWFETLRTGVSGTVVLGNDVE